MSDFPLPSEQAEQEHQYIRPYHWFWFPDTEQGRAYFSYLDMVAQLIPPATKLMLDVGCGDGRSSVYFAEHFPGARVTGSDYSAHALALARAMSAHPRIEWKRIDLEEGDPSGARYDAITAIEVFEHLPPERLPVALRNIRNLLNNEGVLILTVPSILMPVPKKHYQHFTVALLSKLITEANFEIVEIRGQQKHAHALYALYKMFDNRFWTLKPLARWFNAVVYPRVLGPSVPGVADRLIVKAVAR